VGLETPVQGAGENILNGEIGERNEYLPYDPVLKALYVTGNHLVNVRSPGWNFRFIYRKCIDRLLTEVPNVVDGALQGEIMILHKDDDHVVRITSRLFDVIRKDILEVTLYRFT
jgi:hypothetical protein